VAEQVETFNNSQSDYTVVATHKGNYSETLNAGIAAFRAGEQPDILMVFEVGTATMMAAQGAIKPVYEVMGDGFDQSKYIGSVKGYYTSPEGDMLSLPFNSSTPVLWVNRDKLQEAGIDPDTDMSTWEQVGTVLDQLKDAGVDCPMTTAWQAYHDVPFASKSNGFDGSIFSRKTSAGVLNPRHLRGVAFMRLQIDCNRCRVISAGSRSRGKSRLARPLVFSFVPFCHGALGSQYHGSTPNPSFR